MELQTLLRKQQYPWYHVKGPMAATLAYLKEWGWHTNSLYEWHRNETAFMTEAQVDLRQPWWQVEELLQAEAKQQRQHRFASRRNCQALVSGIDWTTASKATKRPRPHTSALGTKRPSGSRMAPAPNCAPSVKFRRHRSTSCGCANGTTTKSTHHFQCHGPKGSKTRWKSLSGLTGGFQKSHRTTSRVHSAWRGMAVGNLWNHFHYNRGKGSQSL